MSKSNLNVLYEDNHCLVVFKPPGMLTHRDKTEDTSLADLAKVYLKEKYNKPGNVYLGVVHRLDRPTSGVVLFARTTKAGRRLHEQFRERRVEKVYWAIVHGRPAPAEDRLEAYVYKHPEKNIVRVSHTPRPDAKRAVLNYRTVQPGRKMSLLEVTLETGRSHQIRVQLADAGWPIVGDVKYDSPARFGYWFALHHRALVFEHPTKRESMRIEAPAPEEWAGLGVLTAG